MADIISAALDLASSDPTVFGVVFAIGFLTAHVIHAVRYGFFRFGSFFMKLGYFVKYLLFLRVQ